MSPKHDKALDGDTNENNGLRKGTWSLKEDEILAAYVKKHGEGNWNEVQNNSGLARCGKSCRLRWLNHLKPDLKKGSFSEEEQQQIFQLYSKFGTKWCKIALELPGRTDNEIKNFWNTRKRKLERAGLPPLHPIKPKKLNDSRGSLSGFGGKQVNVPPISNINENKNSTQGYSGSFHPPLGDSNTLYNAYTGHSIQTIDNSLDRRTCMSNNTNPTLIDRCLDGTSITSEAMVSDLPPFPPCIEDQDCGRFASPPFLYDDLFHTSIRSPAFRPQEETQYELSEPVSPRSNGLLESLYYPPKDLDVSDVASCSSMHYYETRLEDKKGKSNYLENDDISNKRELTKALIDLGWLDKDD